MTTTFISPDLDALVAEIDIAAPAERVFKALTDPAQLKHWFTSPECPAKIWNMDARLGGKYDYATEKGTRHVNRPSELQSHRERTAIDRPILPVDTGKTTCHGDSRPKPAGPW